MSRRAQGKARRKAGHPGVLGPKRATSKVDPRRQRRGPSQPQGRPGVPRTSDRLKDHVGSEVQRSGSPLKRRSMENPPLLHEQDTLGWAVPGRIRTRSRGSRPEAESADFFFHPVFSFTRRPFQQLKLNPNAGGDPSNGRSGQFTLGDPFEWTRDRLFDGRMCNPRPRQRKCLGRGRH